MDEQMTTTATLPGETTPVETTVVESDPTPVVQRFDDSNVTGSMITNDSAILPQGCSSCGDGGGETGGAPQSPEYVYAIGRIEARFPSMAIEKEFMQAVRDGDTVNLTDQQVLHRILSRPENRYLAREVCWTYSIESVDAYVVVPRSDHELEQLVEAIKPTKEYDCDVVIGVRGPLAPPQMCNGLQAPIVFCDRVYSFSIEEFISAIPKPKGMREDPFREAARDLFARIMQLTDNAGSLDKHRAFNYLALRYSAIYSHTMEMLSQDKALSSVEARTSRLSGARKIVDVIFSYTNRSTDVTEKSFVRVDIAGKYPFLVSQLQPFYDR